MKSMFDYLIEEKKINIFEKIYHRGIRKIPDLFYGIRDFFLRVFRKSHTSYVDIWNLYSHLSKIILPKLLEFKKAKRVSYPSIFSSFENLKDSGITKEEYEKHFIGGEKKIWEEILDKMIFSFEYIVYNEKFKIKEFYKKYNLEDPHAKTEENKKIGYVYKSKFGTLFSHEKDEKEGEFLGEYASYYNLELDKEINERVEEGLKLFGEYFRNLWD